MQNFFNKCGVTQMIFMFLSNSKNIMNDNFNNVILLANQILEGGNFKVQQSFYDFFLKADNSENFFKHFYQQINQEIEKNSKILTLSGYEKIFNTLKRMDYIYKDNKRYNIANFLRLFQLLTENHNFQIQVILNFIQ